MVESVEKKWYVLHTYSGYENKVKANLESRAHSMGMEENIFRVIVPEETEPTVEETTETTEPEVETRKSRRAAKAKAKVEKHKIFPGYVLVEMIMTDQAWFVVRNTPGVTGFVGSHGSGSKPAPLLDSEIKQLLAQLQQTKSPDADVPFSVDETIIIKEGLLQGTQARIIEIDQEARKLKAKADIIGSNSTVELDFNQVDKLIK